MERKESAKWSMESKARISDGSDGEFDRGFNLKLLLNSRPPSTWQDVKFTHYLLLTVPYLIAMATRSCSVTTLRALTKPLVDQHGMEIH